MSAEAAWPTATDEYEQTVIRNVQQWGWHVVLVPEDDQGPGFAFTVGLQRQHRHPELILIGLPLAKAHHLLNDLGSRVREGRQLLPGQRLSDLLEGYDCRISAVHPSHHRDFLGVACWFSGGCANVQALQLLWPDQAGRFPGETGFPAALADRQPRLDSPFTSPG